MVNCLKQERALRRPSFEVVALWVFGFALIVFAIYVLATVGVSSGGPKDYLDIFAAWASGISVIYIGFFIDMRKRHYTLW